MALPVLAFFPWLVGLFSSILGGLFTWFITFTASRLAVRLTLATAFLIAVAGITAAVALSIKGFIFGIQYAMPTSLGAATYFLPNNINLIMGAYVSMRVAFYLYYWTTERLGVYIKASM